MKKGAVLLLVLAWIGVTAGGVLADATDDLITEYYLKILDRNPDAAGAEQWKNEIQRIVALGIDRKEGFIALAKLYFNSDEYTLQNKDNLQYVTDLYQTFFDREPDESGIDYWVDQLDQGLNRNVILNHFVYSDEFRLYMEALFGSESGYLECNLVNDLYRGLLDRLPDTVGFSYWVDLMRQAQGTGPAAVRELSHAIASGFINSDEYRLRDRDARELLEDLYNGILRRGAAPVEFDGWISFLASGMTPDEVVQSFTDSDEFQLRVQAVSAAVGDSDNDQDGFSINQGDCNDRDSNLHPGAAEICGDGIDQDCSGSDLPCAPGPGGSCITVRQGGWEFEWQYNGSTVIGFTDGDLKQSGCYISYDFDNIFAGPLSGDRWQGQNAAEGFGFEGRFIGNPAEQFRGTWTLLDGSGTSGEMLGYHGTLP
ncbi:MAG: DUF4214 domain-containing protein [Desulfobacterales bacterium]|nr:MAG: DUF4214 domain-containing protein [Desulfobacterales bacterium]